MRLLGCLKNHFSVLRLDLEALIMALGAWLAAWLAGAAWLVEVAGGRHQRIQTQVDQWVFLWWCPGCTPVKIQ